MSKSKWFALLLLLLLFFGLWKFIESSKNAGVKQYCENLINKYLAGETELKDPNIHKPAQISVVIDTSASMKINDPNRLSLLAAMMISDMAHKEDYISVTKFYAGNRADENWIKTLGLPDLFDGQQTIKELVRKIEYNNNYTYFLEPLKKGLFWIEHLGNTIKFEGQVYPYEPNRSVILLTDGRVDRDGQCYKKENINTAKCRSDFNNEVRDLSTKVVSRAYELNSNTYVLALGKDVEKATFDPMLVEMEGKGLKTMYRTVLNSHQLIKAFAEVFARILGTQVEALDNKHDTIKTYKITSELIVVTSANNTNNLEIEFSVDPSGKSDSEERHGPEAVTQQEDYIESIDKKVKTYYRVYKIEKPIFGDWKIKLKSPESPEQEILAIANNNLYMKMKAPKSVQGGRNAPFELSLHHPNGELVDDEDVIKALVWKTELHDSQNKLKIKGEKNQRTGIYEGEMIAPECSSGDNTVSNSKMTMSVSIDPWLFKTQKHAVDLFCNSQQLVGKPITVGKITPCPAVGIDKIAKWVGLRGTKYWPACTSQEDLCKMTSDFSESKNVDGAPVYIRYESGENLEQNGGVHSAYTQKKTFALPASKNFIDDLSKEDKNSCSPFFAGLTLSRVPFCFPAPSKWSKGKVFEGEKFRVKLITEDDQLIEGENGDKPNPLPELKRPIETEIPIVGSIESLPWYMRWSGVWQWPFYLYLLWWMFGRGFLHNAIPSKTSLQRVVEGDKSRADKTKIGDGGGIFTNLIYNISSLLPLPSTLETLSFSKDPNKPEWLRKNARSKALFRWFANCIFPYFQSHEVYRNSSNAMKVWDTFVGMPQGAVGVNASTLAEKFSRTLSSKLTEAFNKEAKKNGLANLYVTLPSSVCQNEKSNNKKIEWKVIK